MRRAFSHEIVIGRPLETAFPLFTPKGEEDWVPGWRPDYFAPEDGKTGKDMLFATGEGTERTWWTCLEWRPEEHRVRYLRLTPDSRAAFVSVSCRARDAQSTLVTVGYDIQSLGPAGDAYIAAMSDDAFAAMIGEWPALIGRMARERGSAPTS
ncbi:MAG: hypothetical protein WAU86_21815 [Oricola sp.]